MCYWFWPMIWGFRILAATEAKLKLRIWMLWRSTDCDTTSSTTRLGAGRLEPC
ncbi:UNVERIFIED_CONTAM: hypothetical protein GTU68_030017 [Idotea baltica]|nr:hypothetical protein [Idotea baltica]